MKPLLYRIPRWSFLNLSILAKLFFWWISTFSCQPPENWHYRHWFAESRSYSVKELVWNLITCFVIHFLISFFSNPWIKRPLPWQITSSFEFRAKKVRNNIFWGVKTNDAEWVKSDSVIYVLFQYLTELFVAHLLRSL